MSLVQDYLVTNSDYCKITAVERNGLYNLARLDPAGGGENCLVKVSNAIAVRQCIRESAALQPGILGMHV